MDVVVEEVTQISGTAGTASSRWTAFSHRFRSRRFSCLLGPERLRQEHAGSDRRRPGARDQRHRAHPGSRTAGRAAPARRRFGHGLAEPQSVSLAQRARQRRLRAGDARHAAQRSAIERARALIASVGLARLRAPSAGPTVGRHAPARRPRPRADHGAADHADGRAVRRARRADQDRHAGGAAAHLRQTHKTILFVTHAIEEAILLGDEVVVMTRAPRPHQGGAPGRSAAAALARDGQHQGIRRAFRPRLSSHPRGSDDLHGAAGHGAGARRHEREARLDGTARRAGAAGAHRRAVHRSPGSCSSACAASRRSTCRRRASIAVYLWRMIADGSHRLSISASRLLRIFAGFALAAVAGVALGVLMGMSRIAGAHRRSLDRGALSAAEDLADPAADHLARHRRGLQDRDQRGDRVLSRSSSAPMPASARSTGAS